jgi:hypothetical protein
MKKILLLSVFTALLLTAVYAVPRDMVVVEIGTGTWCQYCPGAAMGADDLVENHHRAAIVENHNGDPYTNNYSNARNSYYGITGYPTANFDGANPSVGGSNTTSLYPSYRTKVNSRLAITSNYTISATGGQLGLVYNVAVTVTRLEADTNTNIKLHAVLTESGMQVNWQGQTHLEFVQRLMAPDQYGTDIDFSTAATQTVNLTFTALPAWNAEHFEFVFFLQNNTSKEILQGCKYKLQALENASPLSVQNLDFGIVNQGDMASQSFTVHNWWTQDMNIDVSVDNPDFFVFPQSRDEYVIPFYEDLVFDVFLTANTLGVNNATVTITTDNPACPTVTLPLSVTVNGVANGDANSVPSPNRIISIAPNPFHSHASIKYSLNRSNPAVLQIYNVKGAKVFSIPLISRTSGEQSYLWSGKDNSGKSCPSGVYFCNLSVDGRTVSTQKLVILK